MKADREIIAVFKTSKGNEREKAFNELVRKYQERVYWVCRRMLNSHDDADDAAQNAFIKMYHALDNFNETSEFFTWAYRIATNETINMIRSQTVRRASSIDDLVEDPAASDISPDESMMLDEERAAVEDAIASLPEKQRAVFVMRYYDEMSYEQIAEVTGTSVGGLKANYFHALSKVEAFLKQRFNLKEPLGSLKDHLKED
ncbi:MAG: sigma-70 family RNA polymerase sigma factor [Chloroherpetonaceae bacterium]|nr:sigma-70 family RNA polymerase sigma factor [Chloroherpetonaceae bacterium]